MTEKSYLDTAMAKGLDLPDSETGMVQTSYTFMFKGVQEASLKSLHPNDQELGLINANAIIPQVKEDWVIFRNVDVLGFTDQYDRQGDKFDPQVERTMAAQAAYTPLLLNHDHNLSDKGPIGLALKGEVTPRGYRETWAVPLVDYNADVIDGLMKGTINKVSIGALYDPSKKICVVCDKSIYSSYCPHEPGKVDSSGNLTKILVKDISHYLERSLVNCPARVGTNINGRKSIDGEETTMSKELNSTIEGPGTDNVEIIKSTDTISPVNTIEDNTVAKDSEKTEAQIEAEKGVKDQTKPIPLSEATTKEVADPAVEETEEEKAEKAAKAEADAEAEKAAKKKPAEPDADDMAKAAPVEYLLADEHVTLLKSLGSNSEDLNTKFNKSVEMHTEQTALIAKQAEQITTLVEMNKALAGQVEKVTKLVEDTASTVKVATETSTESVLTKLVEIVKAAQEMKQPAKAPAEASDPWDVLFK